MRVVGIAGWSGSGKTTLIEKLLPRLIMGGLRVSTIKHAHHRFDIDKPGKDSWRHREAGASEVVVLSGGRWVLMHELRDEPEPALTELLARMAPVDLVLLEGFKRLPVPKIEVWRDVVGKPLLAPDDPDIRAIAAQGTPRGQTVPVLPLDNVDAIADCVRRLAFRDG